MKGTNKLVLVLTVMTLMVLSSIAVFADPIGIANDVSGVSSESRGGNSPYTGTAIAGNVTSMNIDAISVTQVWAGYYGNVTGTIVLANSNNATMYDWNVSAASGQVYASRSSSITWANVGCADAANITAEDAAIGSAGRVDAVNETFLGATTHSQFYVGSVNIVADSCDAVKLHNSTEEDGLFTNVLLEEGSNIIYTSILSDDADGFDGQTHDFQLIVGENGTNGNTATTNYYFWVELA